MNDVKKKILTKSSELFVKQGVRRTSMDEISSSLSISKRTVYECFRSKEELLKICVLNRIEEYKNEVEIKTRGIQAVDAIKCLNSLLYTQLIDLPQPFLEEIMCSEKIMKMMVKEYYIPLSELCNRLLDEVRKTDRIKKEISNECIIAFFKHILLTSVVAGKKRLSYDTYLHFIDMYWAVIMETDCSSSIKPKEIL